MTFRGFTQQLAPSQFGPPTGEVAIGAAESQGTAGVAAEADHVHAFPAAPAGDGATTSLPGDTEADGTATTPARARRAATCSGRAGPPRRNRSSARYG